MKHYYMGLYMGLFYMGLFKAICQPLYPQKYHILREARKIGTR